MSERMLDRIADVIFDLGHGTKSESMMLASAVLDAMQKPTDEMLAATYGLNDYLAYEAAIKAARGI